MEMKAQSNEKNASGGVSVSKKIYSVSELNRTLRQYLEGVFSDIWLEGEVSNFKHHSSGHMYFSLKDETAQVSAVFFSRWNRSLKFNLEDGLKVLVKGRISVYEPRGQYQIYVEQVLPKGVGELQLAFEQLRVKLEKEGLFDPSHKKPIPRFPQCVGVVTSPTGAAIRDILNVVNRRFHGTNVLLVPVQVQGAGSAEQIAKAICELNAYGQVDVMIVGRGGGSLEDLWAFNEEVVARAVYASKIPVISAVGHEIDWTICDWVADLRAPTPSAAAELVVQNREEIEQKIEEFHARLSRALQALYQSCYEKWESLSESTAFRQPRVLIDHFSQRLDEWARQLQNYLKSVIADKAGECHNLMGKLDALSPLAILERGYSVSFLEDGKLLRKKSQVQIGQILKTRITDAVLMTEVKQIKNLPGG